MGASPVVEGLDRERHRALVARVLRIDGGAWTSMLDRFHAHVDARDDTPQRLRRLAELVAARYPESVPTRAPALADARTGSPGSACPACGATEVAAWFRRSFAEPTLAPYLYAACAECGHARLVGASVPIAAYASPAYYQVQGADGTGYDRYEQEREYREAKGEALLGWVLAHAPRPPRTMLEVGSAFGFTRHAAERLGVRTVGIDLNPFAAEGARRLYGMSTVVGTLADAMAEGALAGGGAGDGRHDLVLYDFVLEHVADPVGELRLAAANLASDGMLVLRIPGMDALELEPFGSFYRSFRSDHLHLFTRESATRMLAAAGLTITAYRTSCGADLLREILPEPDLLASYAQGRGPDITLCAMSEHHAPPLRHPA